MHIFSLGVRKMIKENVDHMLCDEMRTTPEIKMTNDMMKKFTITKSTVMKVTSKFLRDTEQQCLGYGLERD